MVVFAHGDTDADSGEENDRPRGDGDACRRDDAEYGILPIQATQHLHAAEVVVDEVVSGRNGRHESDSRQHPGDGDDDVDVARRDHGGIPERLDERHVSVHADDGQRPDGHRHRRAVHHAGHLTPEVTVRPPARDGRQEGRRTRDNPNRYVGHTQIDHAHPRYCGQTLEFPQNGDVENIRQDYQHGDDENEKRPQPDWYRIVLLSRCKMSWVSHHSVTLEPSIIQDISSINIALAILLLHTVR